MSTCATCQHWGVRGPSHHDDAVVADWDHDAKDGKVIRIQDWDALRPVNATYKACAAIPMGPVEFSRQTSPGAVVVDGSEYYAALLTTADFSCALFSEATSPPKETK